jgi:molybdate transport repressor ModE-like protein
VNLNHLSWDDLRIFLSVARSGSLSKAGRQLGIDQSTVWRRISALEYSLRTPIFERDRSGYRLNEKGRDILANVEEIEASVMRLGDALESGELGPGGVVRIATMEGIASLYLSEQLVALQRLHPRIIVELATSAQDVRVSQRESDIFLGFFEPAGANLDVRKIGEFSLGLYAHPEYISEHGNPSSLDDLRIHRFVGYISDLISLDAVRWLEELISAPQVNFRSSSMLAQMFAASAGCGIVMLPAFARPERFGLVEVLSEQFDVRRELWISSHQYLRSVSRIQTVMNFVSHVIGRDYPETCVTRL